METIATEPAPLDDRYFEFVRQYPLELLRDDRDLDHAMVVVDELLDKAELSVGEREYLAVLSLLIADYERGHISLPGVTPVDLLKHLMEENNLTQADVAPLFGGNRSIISEVLSAKRTLALSHIRQLSTYFGLPADLFIQ